MKWFNRTKERWKIILEIIFAIFFIITMAVLLECGVFQFKAFQIKEKAITFRNIQNILGIQITEEEGLAELTADEQNSIRINRESEKILAEYSGLEYEQSIDETLIEKDDTMYRKITKTSIEVPMHRDYYIAKFDLRAAVESDSGYTLILYHDGEQVGDAIYCSMDAKIGAGIANVKRTADTFKIILVSAQDIPLESISVTVSNPFKINWYRVFFFSVLFGTIAWLITGKRTVVEKPEWTFVYLAFTIGSLLIWGIGTNQVGYDEYTHAKTAYDMSFGAVIETTESAMQMKGNLLPFFSNPEERALVEAYEQENHDFSWADITYQSRVPRTEDYVYFPNAIGFKLARMFHMDFAASVMMAKYGNLICYILIVFLAIALAQHYKILVAVIGLLPNYLFSAASLTRDGVINAFLLLATVLLTNQLLDKDKKLSWQAATGILIAFSIGSVAKPVYIVMACMLLFFGKEKFQNRPQEVIFKISVCVVVGFMLYSIFKPLPSAGSDFFLVNNSAHLGDKRNEGTSFLGQIQYILANPLTYTKLLLSSMFGMLFDYLVRGRRFLDYGYMGGVHFLWNWAAIALAFFVSVITPIDEDRKVLNKKYIFLNLLMVFGVSAILWTSMYVSYTGLGKDEILGVQGRYFIPLFLPFFSCFFMRKRKIKIKKEWIHKTAFCIIAFLNLYMIYEFVLTAINI